MKVPTNFHLPSLLWLCDSEENATSSSVTRLRSQSMEFDGTLLLRSPTGMWHMTPIVC